MDNSLSDSRSATSVIYRCPCGERLSLLVSSGGVCESCGRNVTARMLQHDLAMTVTLDEHDDESEATGTFSFELNSPNGESVGPEEANPDVLIGKMYGHFRLISPIGHGGMGQVYRALDTSLQRYAAVKILRSGIGTDVDPIQPGPCSTEVDKLLQEAVSQARVTHPNVVTIYYVGKQDESPFLAMELVNGDPLSERIKNNSLRFDEVWPISIALADALKVSYEIGMLHGDIKPSNVLMDKSKSIKLSDFGMARDVRDESAVTGGTPNYIAPEVLKGEKPGLQSDIYSLGVTFFEMTFGRLPVELDGRAVADWIAKHESEELVFPDPWPEHLPRSWESILRKMLAKLPEDRYRSYDELIDDLELIEPDNKVVAQVFPRIVAAGVDWITILFMAGLLQISARNDVFASLTSNKQIAAILLGFLQFLPLILYLLVINSWRQSLGRRLMHLKIVNRYGVSPTSRAILMRTAIRMQFPIIAMLVQVLGTVNATWFQLSLSVLFMSSMVVLFLDGFMVLLSRQNRALHDLMTKTRVVLDTRTPGGDRFQGYINTH